MEYLILKLSILTDMNFGSDLPKGELVFSACKRLVQLFLIPRRSLLIGIWAVPIGILALLLSPLLWLIWLLSLLLWLISLLVGILLLSSLLTLLTLLTSLLTSLL